MTFQGHTNSFRDGVNMVKTRKSKKNYPNLAMTSFENHLAKQSLKNFIMAEGYEKITWVNFIHELAPAIPYIDYT